MSENVTLTVDISPTDASVPLGFEAWLDDDKFYDTSWVQNNTTISHEFADTNSERTLKLVLKNKLPEHTEVDDNGNITKDALIAIGTIKIDDIDITTLFLLKAEYTHDFNGSAEPTTQQFGGSVGCNGTVSLKFSSPVYLWLLENM